MGSYTSNTAVRTRSVACSDCMSRLYSAMLAYNSTRHHRVERDVDRTALWCDAVLGVRNRR